MHRVVPRAKRQNCSRRGAVKSYKNHGTLLSSRRDQAFSVGKKVRSGRFAVVSQTLDDLYLSEVSSEIKIRNSRQLILIEAGRTRWKTKGKILQPRSLQPDWYTRWSHPDNHLEKRIRSTFFETNIISPEKKEAERARKPKRDLTSIVSRLGSISMSEFNWLRFLSSKIRRVANSEASVAVVAKLARRSTIFRRRRHGDSIVFRFCPVARSLSRFPWRWLIHVFESVRAFSRSWAKREKEKQRERERGKTLDRARSRWTRACSTLQRLRDPWSSWWRINDVVGFYRGTKLAMPYRTYKLWTFEKSLRMDKVPKIIKRMVSSLKGILSQSFRYASDVIFSGMVANRGKAKGKEREEPKKSKVSIGEREKKKGEIDTAFIIGCTPIEVRRCIGRRCNNYRRKARGSPPSIRFLDSPGQLPFSVRGIISQGRSQPGEPAGE